MRLRDNSGTASSMTTASGYDLTGAAAVEVDFIFYPYSMETGEDFWVHLYDRSAARRTMFPYADFHGLVAHDTLLFAAQPLEGNLPALRREAAALLRDTATRNGLKLAVFGNHSLRLQCEALARRERALLGLIGADLRE